ncbi:MAG: hypothetical protein ACI4OO_11020 [Otoolea sp.]
MRMKNRRRISVLMASVMILGAAAPVQAAAPKVEVDETMYVNLDYYGVPTKTNVVKGCSTNGIKEYTDYGTYEKVVNMTDKTEPVLADGSVTWQLPQGNQRFYYQCTMPDGSMELPWTFDVSYKLNGVSADASSLAGASGLVEIHIEANPNEAARAYYRNNMILTVAVPVDLEKCYSVDAPGSQTQTLGSMTAVVFAALPGEEGDYTVRIGTDDFESVGVIMMMVPGTLDTLNHIKDIKELKDTWREDGDRMYESMDRLLESMESMRQDVVRVSGGLSDLDQGRSVISGKRKQIEALSTQAIADLNSVTQQTAVLIPYLETAKNAVTDINYNMDAISNTLEDTEDELDRLYDRLKSLKNSLNSVADQLEKGISPEEEQLLLQMIGNETAEISQILGSLEGMLGGGRTFSEEVEEDLEDLEESLEQSDAFRYERTAHAATESQVNAFGTEEDGGLLTTGPSGLLGSGGVNDEDFEEWSEELDPYADEVEEALQALSGTSYPAAVRALLSGSRSLYEGGTELIAGVHAAVIRINQTCAGAADLASGTASTVSALRGVTDELINLMDDSRVLIATMDGYVPSILDSLSDTQELLNCLTRALNSTYNLLSVVNQTLISAGDSLDAGTRESLKGLQQMMEKSVSMLDAVSEIRGAGREMKQTLDDELDEFEEENQFLNLDPEADMISFTSAKNPSPHSLQIVLRTDEISEEDKTTDISDLESENADDVGPLRRMWNVLVEIFRAVVAIFKNR